MLSPSGQVETLTASKSRKVEAIIGPTYDIVIGKGVIETTQVSHTLTHLRTTCYAPTRLSRQLYRPDPGSDGVTSHYRVEDKPESGPQSTVV